MFIKRRAPSGRPPALLLLIALVSWLGIENSSMWDVGAKQVAEWLSFSVPGLALGVCGEPSSLEVVSPQVVGLLLVVFFPFRSILSFRVFPPALFPLRQIDLVLVFPYPQRRCIDFTFCVFFLLRSIDLVVCVYVSGRA